MRPFATVCIAILFACNGGKDDAAGVPAVAASVDVLDFGILPANEVLEQTFTLSNAGTGDLDIYTVILADGDDDVWDVTWDRETPLNTGTAVVTVSFSPEEANLRYGGQVQVRTSDPEMTSLFVSLLGEGAASVADEDGDGFTSAEGDCDDTDPDRNPGEAERCNGVDDDCDGEVPSNEDDGDGDGVRLCDDDCDDTNNAIFPGAPEICDGFDSDCDGINQDDVDGDGDGISPCQDDCDDTDPTVFPGGIEVCGDNADNDCEGTVDSIDADADGHNLCGLYPDCDDADPAAFPRVVEPGAAGIGSAADPLGSLADAVASVDTTCRQIFLLPGSHDAVGVAWSAGDVAITGTGAVRDEVILDAGIANRHLDISGGSVTLEAMVLVDGSATDGGAIRVVDAALILNDVALTGNLASGRGGALFADNSSVTLQGAPLFENNLANGGGGAVAVVNGGSFFDQSGTVYLNNDAEITQSGGAVLLEGTTGLIANARFESNSAGRGGGLAILGGGGHLLQRSSVWKNSAVLEGGGMYLSDTVSAQVRNNLFQDNAAQSGGGASLMGVSAFTNNTLAGNGTTGDGAAVWVGSEEAAVLGNLGHFQDGPSAVFVDPAVLVPNVTHNTVFATSSAVDFAGAVAVDVDANTSENPLFVDFSDDNDPSNDDLGLQAGSPALDTGPPDPLYNDTDGTRNDRGATGGPGAP